MNKRVSWEFCRINGDGLARMALIRAGNLQSETALGTANQYCLALAQIMETQLLLAGRLGYLMQGTAEGVLALHDEVERMLDALIRSLKAKISADH